MPAFIKNLTVDCADAVAVARFWAAALGSDVDEDSTPERAYVEAAAWGGPNIWFRGGRGPKRAANRVHLDLRPLTSMDEEVERLVGLGAWGPVARGRFSRESAAPGAEAFDGADDRADQAGDRADKGEEPQRFCPIGLDIAPPPGSPKSSPRRRTAPGAGPGAARRRAARTSRCGRSRCHRRSSRR
jgi:hypothetical protein